MDRLPIFLRMAGKRCLVVGGGVVAERKIRLLKRSKARISIIAASLTDQLRHLIDSGEVEYLAARYERKLAREFWLVVAATDDQNLNCQIAADADDERCFCNVVDDNEASSFILPAIVDRSPVVIAIGTEGNAPVLAQQLKNQIEEWIPARISELAVQAGRWRDLVKKRFHSVRERRRFWQRFFAGPITEHLLAGRQTAAEKFMRAELVGDVENLVEKNGEAAIVGAGPGDPGLLTLRAKQLISRADVVLYDRLVSKPILDFARKEADLISVGKRAGSQVMSQQEINDLLVHLVRQGERVCRLKGGDPFVFGRGGEEAVALANANLPYQIVPGISAALGCAAYAGIPLTMRGVSASVTLATAKLDNDTGVNWPQLLQGGDTLVLYMGVNSIASIREELLGNNISSGLPVAFVENGTTQEQRTVFTTVEKMQDDAAAADLKSPCIIYVGKTVGIASQLQWFEKQSRATQFSSTVDGEAAATAGSLNTGGAICYSG